MKWVLTQDLEVVFISSTRMVDGVSCMCTQGVSPEGSQANHSHPDLWKG